MRPSVFQSDGLYGTPENSSSTALRILLSNVRASSAEFTGGADFSRSRNIRSLSRLGSIGTRITLAKSVLVNSNKRNATSTLLACICSSVRRREQPCPGSMTAKF